MSDFGILFDLDGTLIDSTPAVERIWVSVANEAQVPLEKLHGLHGIPTKQAVQMIMSEASEKEILYWATRIEDLQIDDTEGVVGVAGVYDMFADLALKKIKWTIVTSCTLPLAKARAKAGNLLIPENSVTFDDVKLGKPFPDPYLLGAQRLGLDPKDCWVLEDAPAGITSGKAAGCKVVAIVATHERKELSQADYIIDHLDELVPLILK
jgi:sugar-phosphatase